MLKWVSGQWVKYHKSATHVTDSNLPCMVTNNWQKSIVTDNLSDNTCPSILLGSSPTVIQYYPVFRAFPILPDHSLFKIWRVWCHNGNDLGLRQRKKIFVFPVTFLKIFRVSPNCLHHCRACRMKGEWGWMGIIFFTHSSLVGWMGMNNILGRAIHPYSSTFMRINGDE